MIGLKKVLVIVAALSLAFGLVLVSGNEVKAEGVTIQASPGGGGGGGNYPST
jgi:hypothetical protein